MIVKFDWLPSSGHEGNVSKQASKRRPFRRPYYPTSPSPLPALLCSALHTYLPRYKYSYMYMPWRPVTHPRVSSRPSQDVTVTTRRQDSQTNKPTPYLVHQSRQAQPIPKRAHERLQPRVLRRGLVVLAHRRDSLVVEAVRVAVARVPVRVVGAVVGDEALAQRVVGGDDAAGAEEAARRARRRHRQDLPQVPRVPRLVRVDEDDVVGLAYVGELGEAGEKRLGFRCSWGIGDRGLTSRQRRRRARRCCRSRLLSRPAALGRHTPVSTLGP